MEHSHASHTPDTQLQALLAQVQQAIANHTALNICGGGSKSFIGNARSGDNVNIGAYSGIVNYEPSELVVTAKAGTPLAEIEAVLEASGQMLGFEPPHYGAHATIGGTIACALSGPRRAYAGAARDFVLGCQLINGNGELLRFGGEVMKNVAGYDVSRLMVGAMGTLGVLTEVSLKVLPKPECEQTVVVTCDAQKALDIMHQLALTPLPISATCYVAASGKLYVRFSSSLKNVEQSMAKLEGDVLDDNNFWQQVKEQQLPAFSLNESQQLWRFSLPSTTAPIVMPVSGEWIYEWGGALRWFVSSVPCSSSDMGAIAKQLGGYAYCLRSASAPEHMAAHNLDNNMITLHQQVKAAFDPHRLCNVGRQYQEI